MKSFGLKELAEHYFATESEVTDYVAASDYEKLKADYDSILAELQKANGIIIDLQHNPPKLAKEFLAEIKAEAAEVAYYNGFKDALVIELPLPPATCTSATIDVFAYRVDQASRYAASQYAAKIRSTGTWLKDSNVNGGKRQGGEK